MKLLVVRGSSGVTGYAMATSALHRGGSWVCLGVDKTEFKRPAVAADATPMLLAMVQHSAGHVGTVQQMFELDV
jgi:3-hydroxymyristoyl/3-hydroxydecanoyl-(acyl carrier protein) dehydratase